jgi:hypothetical protein
LFLYPVDLGKMMWLSAAALLECRCGAEGFALPSVRHTTGQAGLDDHNVRGVDGAIQQADAADEARLEASGSTMVGQNSVDADEVVRASQLIRSVGWTNSRDREGNDTPPRRQAQPGRSPAGDARCSSWAFPTVQPPKPATHAKKRQLPGHRVVKAPS